MALDGHLPLLAPSNDYGSQLADELLTESVTLPTLPTVVQRRQQVLQDPNVSLGAVGREIALDAPISAKVLRLAISAFDGARERVLSTEHASRLLGPKILRDIILQARKPPAARAFEPRGPETSGPVPIAPGRPGEQHGSRPVQTRQV